jgi:hypothetical protein
VTFGVGQHVSDVLTMNSDAGLNPANVERPKVVYNAATQSYVMLRSESVGGVGRLH